MSLVSYFYIQKNVDLRIIASSQSIKVTLNQKNISHFTYLKALALPMLFEHIHKLWVNKAIF